MTGPGGQDSREEKKSQILNSRGARPRGNPGIAGLAYLSVDVPSRGTGRPRDSVMKIEAPPRPVSGTELVAWATLFDVLPLVRIG